MDVFNIGRIMKLLKRIQTKTLVLYIVFLTLILALIGLGFSHFTARANTDEPEITYIDTDVAAIAFMQHPTRVYFGFILTESDYSDFNNWEGDFAGTSSYERYENEPHQSGYQSVFILGNLRSEGTAECVGD